MCFTVASFTDSEIKGDVLYLGYYQSAFNWDDETAKVTGWGLGLEWGLAELQTDNPGNRDGQTELLCFLGFGTHQVPWIWSYDPRVPVGGTLPHALSILPYVFSRPPSSIG